MIFGFEVNGDLMKISDITGSIGNVTIRGKVSEYAEQPLKNGKSTIVSFVLFDGTDSIVCKKFVFNDALPDVQKKLKNGVFIKLSGDVGFDNFLKDIALSIGRQDAAMLIPDFTVRREDNAFEKRIELHCHTKMSDMDGVSTAKDIIEQAIRFGHKAIAITDHGSVQAFPEAYHTAMDNPGKIKVIYGVEAYLVNDEKKIVTNPNGQALDSKFVVFDIETTGFNSGKDHIIEIGAVKFENGKITERFSEFVNPGVPIPYRITELTSIDDGMVKDAPSIEVILPKFSCFL
jgi:DNA polymerase-3 subunit alpha (Gram-positive type)